ncbi:MAG: hypothetical protein DRI57_18570 [Deltaproteobacteria bacterium]|nr:MAG: hypothetical protein DRI57_18570 [Deltaproteobacteria bacterium]
MREERQKREKTILDEFRRYGRVDQLVREYWHLAYLTVRETFVFHKIPHANEDVEDLRVEVFLQLIKNDCRRLRQYDPEKGLSLSEWIRLIANQTTLNEISKKGVLDLAKRNLQIQTEDIAEMLTYDDQERLDAREYLTLIRDAMKKLPQRDRKVLKKYYFEWISLKEIASLK